MLERKQIIRTLSHCAENLLFLSQSELGLLFLRSGYGSAPDELSDLFVLNCHAPLQSRSPSLAPMRHLSSLEHHIVSEYCPPYCYHIVRKLLRRFPYLFADCQAVTWLL